MRGLIFTALLTLVITITTGCRGVVFVKETRHERYEEDYDNHRYEDRREHREVYYEDHDDYGHDEVCVQTAPPRVKVERYKPRRPGRRYVWVKGRWHWNGHRYHWRAGHWRKTRRGYRRWAPGHWVHKRRGWVWVRGHWRR